MMRYICFFMCIALPNMGKTEVPALNTGTSNNTMNEQTLSMIKDNLLFKDSQGHLFLKVKEIPIGSVEYENKYYNEVGKDDSTLLKLENIVDLDSFARMQSEYYFKDKNYVYVHQQYPARFPAISIIHLSPNDVILLDDYYIKDSHAVFWLTKKLDTQSHAFHVQQLGKGLTLGIGNKHLFWQGDIVDLETFLQFKSSFDNEDDWLFYKEKFFKTLNII